MKKPVDLALLTLLVVGVSFGQTATTRTEKKDGVRSQGGIAEAIIAREEGFWDAWKNRRADFFKANLAAESITVAGMDGGRKRRLWKTSQSPAVPWKIILWPISRPSC